MGKVKKCMLRITRCLFVLCFCLFISRISYSWYGCWESVDKKQIETITNDYGYARHCILVGVMDWTYPNENYISILLPDLVSYDTYDSMLYSALTIEDFPLKITSIVLAHRGNHTSIVGYTLYDNVNGKYISKNTAEANSWWMKDDPSFVECCLSMFPFVN